MEQIFFSFKSCLFPERIQKQIKRILQYEEKGRQNISFESSLVVYPLPSSRLDTLSAILYKGDNLSDFLFALLHIESLWKRVYIKSK